MWAYKENNIWKRISQGQLLLGMMVTRRAKEGKGPKRKAGNIKPRRSWSTYRYIVHPSRQLDLNNFNHKHRDNILHCTNSAKRSENDRLLSRMVGASRQTYLPESRWLTQVLLSSLASHSRMPFAVEADLSRRRLGNRPSSSLSPCCWWSQEPGSHRFEWSSPRGRREQTHWNRSVNWSAENWGRL